MTTTNVSNWSHKKLRGPKKVHIRYKNNPILFAVPGIMDDGSYGTIVG